MAHQLLLDADQHTIEPPDMWQRYLPSRFHEIAPRVVKDEKGGDAWQLQPGVPPMPIGLVTFTRGRHHYEDMDWLGKSYATINKGCYDGRGRLEDMDFDGVQAAVMYPSQRTISYFMDNPDLDFHRAGIDAYNDWIFDEFCAADRSRLVPLAQMPDLGVDEAVKALQAAADKGFPGVIISRWPAPGEAFDPANDPFWAAAQDLDMTVNFHLAVAPSKKLSAAAAAQGSASSGSTIQSMGGTVGTFSSVISASIFSGTLDRFPRLKLVGAETGAGWLPTLNEWMDDHWWRNRTRTNSTLKMLPSEYFRRNWTLTFIREPFTVRNRDAVGVDNLMWSSDYPHHRADWPYSRRVVEDMMEGVPADDRRRMLWENGAKLYRLPTPVME